MCMTRKESIKTQWKNERVKEYTIVWMNLKRFKVTSAKDKLLKEWSN